MSQIADDNTALIVVDVQNDFADPAGSLFVDGGEAVVAAANTAIEAAIERGQLVVYTQDWHPTETPHFLAQGGVWPTHCVRDTWGAALHPDLIVDGPIVPKGTGGEDGYSGFSMRDVDTGAETPTELASILQSHEIEAITVIGLAFDVCEGDRARRCRTGSERCGRPRRLSSAHQMAGRHHRNGDRSADVTERNPARPRDPPDVLGRVSPFG